MTSADKAWYNERSETQKRTAHSAERDTDMKLYPTTLKHAHDVEFRRNRAKNELSDNYTNNGAMTEAEINEAEILIDRLGELLEQLMNSRDGRIAYIEGKYIPLYRETQAWAANARAIANR